MATEQRVHVAYGDEGSGQPAVVLIHGMFGNRSHYERQSRHLAEHWRVIAIDLRGHGESDVPDSGYDLDALASDVEWACADAGIGSAIFCGHSMAVALRVAHRRPDLVRGLVLIDGAILLPPPVVEGQRRLALALEGDGWPEAAIGFFTGVAGGAAERVRADIAAAPRVYAPALLRDIAESNARGDSARELSALGCPLLYVHSHMPLDLQRLRELRPEAWIEEIEGAGHWPMLTVPERVNALLDQFLVRLSD